MTWRSGKLEAPAARWRGHPLRRAATWLGLVLLLANWAPGQQAIKLSVAVPELVKLNDPFWLNCSQHTRQPATDNQEPGDDIYSIKWYKDDEEFYRYLPKAEPQVSTYETNGIQLDVSYCCAPFTRLIISSNARAQV